MKKILVLIGLTMAMMPAAKAQYNYLEDTRTFYGALTGGLTLSQIDGDNYAGYNKTGFTAGAGVYMRVWENIAASMEILYSQKGSNGNAPLNSSNQSFKILNYKVNMNYAEVPIHFWYFDKHNNHFGAGFSYSQIINQTETAQTDPNQNVDFDKFPFKKYDINFLLSGNVRLWKGLFAGMRFNYSLFPVRETTNVPPGFGRAEQYNNMITFKITYIFMGGTGGSAY